MTTDREPLAKILPAVMTELRWRPLFTFFIQIRKPYVVGKTPAVDRRIGDITGGHFEGERLSGRIISGNDWQNVRSDGAWMIGVRALLETDDSALIGMCYQGLRHGPKDVLDALGRGEAVDPRAYYMRVTVTFETASERHGFLNNIIAVADGHRLAQGAIYNVFEIT